MLLTAERVVVDGNVQSGVGIRITSTGAIAAVGPLSKLGRPDQNLRGRVLLPGLVNSHSHAFQRLLRGRTQVAGPLEDNFWTWRQAMYSVASRLDPDAVYVVARQAFLEMLLAGVTTVGEFHYVHHQPDGRPYGDPTALAEGVVRAAREVGIRICLIRVVYLRGDFDAPPSALQKRFCDRDIDEASEQIDLLQRRLVSLDDRRVAWGVAAHSLRAVPADAVTALKTRYGHQPFHIHVSEQPREVAACRAQHGVGPLELLAGLGVLDGLTTLVHATHPGPGELARLVGTGTLVCVCPSTEADLGDGLAPVSRLFEGQIPICLGTDGQTLCSILEEARRLEMHERLSTQRRNVLAREQGQEVAQNVLVAATRSGGYSLGLPVGRLAPDAWADAVTYDLNDPSLAGCDDDSLLAAIVFSADSRAVRDVFVGGVRVVADGEHPRAAKITRAYAATAARLAH